MLFICFRMANISSRVYAVLIVNYMDLWGNEIPWQRFWCGCQMEIFTSSICSYCIVSHTHTHAHTPKICLCLYRQYILYNISFMWVCVCAPMPIQCSSMNDSEDLINEGTNTYTERDTCHPKHMYVCVCAKRLSSTWETCWALKT